jgi:hypothetical protein
MKILGSTVSIIHHPCPWGGKEQEGPLFRLRLYCCRVVIYAVIFRSFRWNWSLSLSLLLWYGANFLHVKLRRLLFMRYFRAHEPPLFVLARRCSRWWETDSSVEWFTRSAPSRSHTWFTWRAINVDKGTVCHRPPAGYPVSHSIAHDAQSVSLFARSAQSCPTLAVSNSCSEIIMSPSSGGSCSRSACHVQSFLFFFRPVFGPDCLIG